VGIEWIKSIYQRKRRFLKEAKHFYREDAKTAKRQKDKKTKAEDIFTTEGHGKTRNQNNFLIWVDNCLQAHGLRSMGLLF